MFRNSFQLFVSFQLLISLLPIVIVRSENKKVNEKSANDKISSRPGHLKPIGESGPMKKIDVVEGFVEPIKFTNEFVQKSRPVLMKNAAKSIPAYHLWTDDYLKSKTPDGEEGNVDVEKGKKETRTEGVLKMNFKKFLDVYNTSDIYMVQDAPSFLKSDLIIPWSIQCEEFKQLLETTVVWFSSGGTKSVLHNDGFENINCLYRGRKRLVFIDINKYRHMEKTILDVRNGAYSSLNVEAVDLDKYPFMQNMEFYEGIMEQGDCIYIPLTWIHHVESFGSNLAVNVWWFPNKKKTVTFCSKQFDTALSLDKFHFKMTESNADQKESSGQVPKYPQESDEITFNTILNNIDIIVYGEDKKYTEIWKGDFIEYFRQDLDKKEACLPIMTKIFNILDVNNDSVLNEKDRYRDLSKEKMKTLLDLARNYDKKVSYQNSGALLITLPFVKQQNPSLYEEESQTESYIDQNVYADFSSRIITDEL